MISTRYAVVVSVLLALALVPTLIHSYYGLLEDDGLTTRAISDNLTGFQSSPTSRKPFWGKAVFDSADWIERRYRSAQGENTLLFAARSYDLKRLYHHPELAVLYGIDLEREDTIQLNESQTIPVHLLRGRTGAGTAAYTLLYDDQFVDNPIWFQLKTSFRLLFGARKPLTLILVYDSKLPRETAFDTSSAARILLAAINSFRAQTPRPSKSRRGDAPAGGV